MEVPDSFLKALDAFLHAAAVGYCVERDVAEAKPSQHTERPLVAFAGYAGQYAAQSRVSWNDWKHLLSEADAAGILSREQADAA